MTGQIALALQTLQQLESRSIPVTTNPTKKTKAKPRLLPAKLVGVMLSYSQYRTDNL